MKWRIWSGDRHEFFLVYWFLVGWYWILSQRPSKRRALRIARENIRRDLMKK